MVLSVAARCRMTMPRGRTAGLGARGQIGAALLLTAACLWSCGGGEGPTDPGALPSPAEIERQLFQLANSERGRDGRTPALLLDGTLSDLARQHSRAMRDQQFFGHVGPQGADLRQRLEAGGVEFRHAAENLAKITDSVSPAAFAHDLLMASTEHRTNILDPEFRRLGVGVAQRQETFWITQIFVAP